MSTIGTGNVAGMNLAGSIAGAQRNNAMTDRLKEAASDAKFQIDQNSLSSKALDDVAEASDQTERDADGRLPYSPTRQRQEDGNSRQSHHSTSPRDVMGERGTTLDLEA